jgi:MscS family membrane protein
MRFLFIESPFNTDASLEITATEVKILSVLAVVAIAVFLIGLISPALVGWTLRTFVSQESGDFYQSILKPSRWLISIVLFLITVDLIVIVLDLPEFTEVGVSLILSILGAWLGTRLFRKFIDDYLVNIVFQRGGKVNELIIVSRFVVNTAIILGAIIIFCETHEINIFGLIASLGIGGLAIAFAAQKTLEQILGGIVLYVDRPFSIEDYISLNDGTFGKVESIGLRSTRIRTTGKGTVVIVPNNAITQMTVENYTGAKKVMAILVLNFYRILPENERALIRRVIVESTGDIYGVDDRNTDVSYRDLQTDEWKRTQAQITFFILGSGESSMELRRQILDIASRKLATRLQTYGIEFDVEEPTIYVDSPITI